MAQRGGQGERGKEVADPHAVNLAEVLQLRRQDLGDDDGELGFGRALVFLELGGPVAAPVPGALGFPEDQAAVVAGVGADPLVNVAAADALANRLNAVVRKSGGELAFQIQLEDLALKLHRTLLGLLFEGRDLQLEVGNDFFLFGHLEALGLGGGFGGLFANGLPLGVELARDFELEGLGSSPRPGAAACAAPTRSIGRRPAFAGDR